MAAAATFTIYMSATAGQSPHELSYLGRLLALATGGTEGDLDDFRVLMKRLRIGRAKGRWKNWNWEPNDGDRAVMSALLYTARPASACAAGRRTSRAGQKCSANSPPSRSTARRAALRRHVARISARAGIGGRQHAPADRLGRGPALPAEGEPAAHRRHGRFRRRPARQWRAGGDLGRVPGDVARPGRRSFAAADGPSARSMARRRATRTRRPASRSRRASSTW